VKQNKKLYNWVALSRRGGVEARLQNLLALWRNCICG